jgi:hypothetical protein
MAPRENFCGISLNILNYKNNKIPAQIKHGLAPGMSSANVVESYWLLYLKLRL